VPPFASHFSFVISSSDIFVFSFFVCALTSLWTEMHDREIIYIMEVSE
jgi:hypothetical protein